MRRLILAATLAASAAATIPAVVPAAAQTVAEQRRFDAARARYDAESRRFQQERDLYDRARSRDPRYGRRGDYRDYDYGGAPPPPGYAGAPPPPGYGGGYYNDDRYEGGYDPARDYRDRPNYQERVLAADERVYAGNDGRYYCRRSDGTTGLIVGGAAGGVLGNVIDGGHSRTAGTLIGAALGALAGKAVDQNQAQIRCR